MWQDAKNLVVTAAAKLADIVAKHLALAFYKVEHPDLHPDELHDPNAQRIS